MKPRSLSASGVDAFSSCPSRWLAESHSRLGSGGAAANLGTSIHSVLEEWVADDHHLSDSAKSNFPKMEKMFKSYYTGLFKTDFSMFDDGLGMLVDWHGRNHPWEEGRNVVSTEQKDNFKLKTSIGEVPFNYIWDRCDELPNNELDVVDYKSIRVALSAEQMKSSIQVRSYALAAAIQFADKDYKRIWVSLDMLRHGSPISVSFSREDNLLTWNYLHKVAEEVIAMDVNRPQEIVNPKCRWCVRKTVCKTLGKYESTGTIASLGTMDELVDRRTEIKSAQTGLKSALDEIDKEILVLARGSDTIDFESTANRALVRTKKTRSVDAVKVKGVVPEDVWNEYGVPKLTLGVLDKMLKDPRITEEVRDKVKGFISTKQGEPFLITEPLGPLE